MTTEKYSDNESTQRNRYGNKKYIAEWPPQPSFGINGLLNQRGFGDLKKSFSIPKLVIFHGEHLSN